MYNTYPNQDGSLPFDASPASPSSFNNLAEYSFPQFSPPNDMPGKGHYRNNSLAVPVTHQQGRIPRNTSNRGRPPARTTHNTSTGQQRSASSNAAEQTYSHGTARFLHEQDSWVPRTFDFQQALSPTPQGPYNFSAYRDPNQLENYSDNGYSVPNDSAYVSQAAPSIYSAPVEPSGELDLDPRLSEQFRIDDSSSIHSSKSNAHSDRRRGSYRRAPSNAKRYTPTKCTHCNEVPRCESDHKKHMLKHEKHFLCDFQHCKRAHEGFGTINDLNRHKKSVHKLSSHVGVTRSFRCKAKACEGIDKTWPRYDNFKQHVIRVHKEEHGDDEAKITAIIESSEFKLSQQRGPQQPAPQVPHSELLAGVGGTGIGGGGAIPTIGFSNVELVSPEGHSLMWSELEQAPAMEEQGIPSTQISAALTRPKKLSKNGQTSRHMAPSNTEDGRGNIHPSDQLTAGSSDQRLSALADVAVATASPAVTITEPLDHPPKKRKYFEESTQGSSAAMRAASQQTNASKLGGEIGANLPQSEKTELQNALASLRNAERILELLKRDQKGLGPEAERVSRRHSNAGGSNSQSDGGIVCEVCEKSLPRNCDMKKHMKRHTRPYGCTFPQCHKTFGSKNDWKRHENSQHFHQEMWRCQEPCDAGGAPDGRCGRVFYYAKTFSRHLKLAHPMTREQRRANIQACRIGRSGHTRYWCGFCKAIVPVNGHSGQAAWDQRFTHIDGQHYKNNQRIDDWLCIVTRVTKGEEREGIKKQTGPDQAETMEDCNLPDLSSDDEDPMLLDGPPLMDSDPDSPFEQAVEPDVVARNPPPQPVQTSDDNNQSLGLYCCQCSYGPFDLGSLYGSCVGPDCSHEFCKRCYNKSGLISP